MYEVRNNKNEVVAEFENYEQAKINAELQHDNLTNHPNFSIYKVEQVWTTQTLDEAIKCDGDEGMKSIHYEK